MSRARQSERDQRSKLQPHGPPADCARLRTHEISSTRDAGAALTPQPPRLPPSAVVAWVAFGKVGSSSMRELLKYRAIRKGWGTYNTHRGMDPCKPSTGALTAGVPSQSACSHVPAGFVVQADYGFCSYFQAATGRPCAYMTMLREPIARLLSGWSYFCLACSEGGRKCPYKGAELERLVSANQRLPWDAHGLPIGKLYNTCPRMNAVEYAMLEGNKYVGMFAKDVCTLQDDPHGEYTGLIASADHLAKAEAVLSRQDLLVLFTEDLDHGGLAELQAFLNASSAEFQAAPPHANDNRIEAGVADAIGDAKLMQRLKYVLRWDIELYRNIHRRYKHHGL